VLGLARTYAILGVAAHEVGVEVDVRGGLPSFSLVGLPDASVRESRERVRAAIVNSGFAFPMERITVNLAPANLPKAGPGYDLAIAVALLVASDQLPAALLERTPLAGELALDGGVRAVPGALPMAERARAQGAERFAVSARSVAEAALANLAGNGAAARPPLRILGLERLADLRALGGADGPDEVTVAELPAPSGDSELPDLADLRGQPYLRWALEVAAAGGHSMLMVGSPGSGKSLAAARLPSILPPLGTAEAIEAMRIASATGAAASLADPRRRPYRAPHHTVSAVGLIGGSSPPRPGEVTLAHRGVLFLDELPEFSRDALEALRQPLEEGRVLITRARQSVELPCRFMLVGAANPCPCGRGTESPECECAGAAVRRYMAKLSGALADRIDIAVTVQQPSARALAGPSGEPSAVVRPRVIAARERQRARLGEGRCNGDTSPAEARQHARLGGDAKAVLAQGHARLRLSARGYDRVLRVARTLADLADCERVGADHVEKALSLRRAGPT
jgi:magnesium chelatase family protein